MASQETMNMLRLDNKANTEVNCLKSRGSISSMRISSRCSSRSNSSSSSSSESTMVMSVDSSSRSLQDGFFSKSRSVSFDKIIIREYDLIAGDNPACSSGAPISLGWKFNPVHEQFPVEVYENYRDGQRNSHEHLKLNDRVRYRMLMERNISSSKIARAERRCRLVQEQRKQTIECLIEEEVVKKMLPRFLSSVKESFQRLFSSSQKRNKT